MSHELLLVAGVPETSASRQRLRILQAAAQRVPRLADVDFHETGHASMAVVTTSPGGGDVVAVASQGKDLRVTLALTQAGVRAAASTASHVVGAEGGHVDLLLGEDGRVELRTDGFATVSLYWGVHDGQLLASTHLASLVSLGLPASPDRAGILQYLAMLHPLGETTTLEGARLLGPGGRLAWRSGEPVREDARPIFVPHDPGRSDDAALDEFRDVWRQVNEDMVDRCRGRRMLLGLSGGLDSRAVADQLVQLGHRPLAYTYGTRANREVVVATAVAERLGLPHVTLPVTDDHLLVDAPDIVDLLDGAHAPTEMYELWYEDRLRSMADVVVNGLAGGPLWGDDKLMGLTDRTTMAERVWHRYRAEALAGSSFLAEPLALDMEPVVRAAIEDSLERWTDVDRPDVGIFWRIATRQLRWGNNLMTALRRAGIRPETPFLDGRFLRFAAGLSPGQRRNGRLYLRAQREIFSMTADLARSDDGNSPDRLNHVYWSGDEPYGTQLGRLARKHPVSATRRALRRAVGQGAGLLGERTGIAGLANSLETRSQVFPADVFARTRPTYAERLADLLEQASSLSDVFDQTSVRAAVDALQSGRAVDSPVAIGRIATLAAWLDDYDVRRAAYLVDSTSG